METFLESERDTNEDEFLSLKYKIRQCLLASSGLVWGICSGAICGFSSIIFLQLRGENNDGFNFTPEQESWTASVVTLVMIPATFPIGWAVEKFGRRFIACFGEMINLIGWIVTYFAHSYHVLIAGRILSGAYMGICLPIYLTYIGEITSPAYRPTCMALTPMGGSIGILIAQFLGNYVSWNMVAIVFVVFPLYNLGVLCYVRESYIWYINKNDIGMAKEAYLWFRGASLESREKFAQTIEGVNKEQSYSLLSVLRLIRTRSFTIPFVITNLTFITHSFSGSSSIVFYTSAILDMISKNKEHQYYTNLLMNVGRVSGAILASILVKKISVKTLLLTTTYALGICMLCLSLFIYLSITYPSYQSLVFLSMICLVLKVILSSCGISPLVMVVCGELYPASVRGIGCSMSLTFSFFYMFVAVKMTLELFNNLGVSLTFATFGCIVLVGITIIRFYLPNTKDKTLKEIEHIYSRKDYIILE